MARHAATYRVATVLLVALLLLPVARDEDGLPLSTYPMYATTRSQVIGIVTAQGVAADGSAVALSITDIAATRDPLIAQSLLNDSVAAGRADQLCRDIAGRLSGDVIRVEVATEQHNTVAFVRNEASLQSRQVAASCPVP